MGVTALDAGRRPTRCYRWQLTVVAIICAGCAEAPLPSESIRRDDCLRELSLAKLNEHLRTCDAVVAAFPGDPNPLNDRYLLHSLAGDDRAACADLRQALALAASSAAGTLDAQLRSDLKVRSQLCAENGERSTPTRP